MKRWLTAGSVLLAAGLLKIWQHANAPMTLEDYLAFRCGGAAGAHGDSLLSSFAGHCWGCPVAAVGAAILVSSLALGLTASRRPVLRRIPARQR